MNGNIHSNNPFRKSSSPCPKDERGSSSPREPSSLPSSPIPTPPIEHHSTQQDLAQHSPPNVLHVAEPPPYEFGYGYTSGICPKKRDTTLETETPYIQPQYSQPVEHSQPYGLPPPPPEPSSSRPLPFGMSLSSPFRSSSLVPVTHEPPPSSFSRQPPQNLAYDLFQTMFLIANGKFLDTGFPLAPPPSAAQPHPFASHDVNEGDWIWFLEALRKASTISDKQNAIATTVPLVQDLPVVSIIVAKKIKSHMKKKKGGPASDLVNTWNHHFFHPRRMEVVLMRGQVRLSGNTERPIPNLQPTIDSPPFSRTSSHDEKQPQPYHEFFIPNQAKGKSPGRGKGKEENDKIYRLFVVPLQS